MNYLYYHVNTKKASIAFKYHVEISCMAKRILLYEKKERALLFWNKISSYLSLKYWIIKIFKNTRGYKKEKETRSKMQKKLHTFWNNKLF